MGWQGRGWRGLAVFLLVCGCFAALAALALYRADQNCLATPGCRSHSGIVWSLLGAALLGYPLFAASLQGLAAFASSRVRARAGCSPC